MFKNLNIKKFNIIYCKKCVTPNTRPAIHFSKEQICSACYNATIKNKINWKKRKFEFLNILKKHRMLKKDCDYDCIAPVSGGKDSVYQTYQLKKIFKMRPLAITWKTPARTIQGEKNLESLRKIGVDHIDFAINPKVINFIRKKSFIKFGDSSYFPFEVLCQSTVDFECEI